MGYKDCFQFTDLDVADALVNRIPELNKLFMESFGAEIESDGTVESLARLGDFMSNKRHTDPTFEQDHEDFLHLCFGYVATLYEAHLPGLKAEISREHFKLNNGRTGVVMIREGLLNLTPGTATAMMLYQPGFAAENLAKSITEHNASVVPSEGHSVSVIRSIGATATLVVDSASGLNNVLTALSRHFDNCVAEANRIDVDIDGWRMELLLSTEFDTEMVAAAGSGAIKYDGQMPATVEAEWAVTAEPDPDMDHFNDFAIAINCVEQAHTAVAHLTL